MLYFASVSTPSAGPSSSSSWRDIGHLRPFFPASEESAQGSSGSVGGVSEGRTLNADPVDDDDDYGDYDELCPLSADLTDYFPVQENDWGIPTRSSRAAARSAHQRMGALYRHGWE